MYALNKAPGEPRKTSCIICPYNMLHHYIQEFVQINNTQYYAIGNTMSRYAQYRYNYYYTDS